jgi:hypothetical protein
MSSTPVRRVPEDGWLATSRSGVVRRVYDAGLAWRVPLLDRWVHGPSGPVSRPLLVRAGTRDGVRVLVVAQAVVTLPVPTVGAAYAAAWPRAELDAEDAVGRFLASHDLAELTRDVPALGPPLRHTVSASVDAHGVAVLELEVVEVTVLRDLAEDEKSLDRGPR